MEDTETHTDVDDLVDELVAGAIDERRKERVASYLGNYGDAAQKRIDRLLKTADELRDRGAFGASVVSSVTAMELILRHYLVRPMLKGELGFNFLADVLVDEILKNRRPAGDRDMLPLLVQNWRLGFERQRVSDAKDSPELWKTFKDTVVPLRNLIVHQGAEATSDEAALAVAIPRRFLEVVVSRLADEVGLSWSATRKWSIVEPNVGAGTSSTTYGEESPFRRNGKIDPP